jgi:hypothetical protein
MEAFGKPSWMTRYAIYYHYKKHLKKVNNDNNNVIHNNVMEHDVVVNSHLERDEVNNQPDVI